MPQCTLFSNDQQNILLDVFCKAAGVTYEEHTQEKREGNDSSVYKFIEDAPITSLIVHLSDAMKDLGYEIKKVS